MKQLIYIVIGLIILFLACQEDDWSELTIHESKLVVEGWIEHGEKPEVLLTLSAPFFAAIDSSNLRDYVVTTAHVQVFSEDTSEVLSLRPSGKYIPPRVYYASKLTGKEGESYRVKIVYNEIEYNAYTIIPEVVYPDSMWYQQIAGSDTLGKLWVRLSDDGSRQDFYRVMIRVKGRDKSYIPAFPAVFSDAGFSGKTIDIAFTRGNAEILESEEERYIQVGDSVEVKFCTIDEATYNFWSTLQSQLITSANPFAASNAHIETNISNGGIGVWGGYAAVYDTIYAK